MLLLMLVAVEKLAEKSLLLLLLRAVKSVHKRVEGAGVDLVVVEKRGRNRMMLVIVASHEIRRKCIEERWFGV